MTDPPFATPPGRVRLLAPSLMVFVCSLILIPVISSGNGPINHIELGRKLTLTTGCNDCHTPGYIETNGNVPEKDWLTGSKIGNGFTLKAVYPKNIRLYFKRISEKNWIKTARTKKRKESMPWEFIGEMTDDELRAIYRFINSLKK